MTLNRQQRRARERQERKGHIDLGDDASLHEPKALAPALDNARLAIIVGPEETQSSMSIGFLPEILHEACIEALIAAYSMATALEDNTAPEKTIKDVLRDLLHASIDS